MKKFQRNTEKGIYYFISTLPAAVFFTVLYTIPVFQGLYNSFTDWNGLSKKINFTGMENYIQIFSDNRFLHSMGFTLRYTALLIIGVLVLSMALALLVTYGIHRRLRTFFRSVFFTPVVLSLVTVGLIFNEIFYRVVPQIGEFLGIPWLSKNILGSPDTVIFGILIVNIWQGAGIPFVMLLAGIQNVPSELYDAAHIDGANPAQVFSKITVPFLLPVINVSFVLTLKNGLTVFDYIQAMTQGGPARASESVGILIYSMAFREAKMNLAMAVSAVLLIIITLVSVVQIKISSKFEAGQL